MMKVTDLTHQEMMRAMDFTRRGETRTEKNEQADVDSRDFDHDQQQNKPSSAKKIDEAESRASGY